MHSFVHRNLSYLETTNQRRSVGQEDGGRPHLESWVDDYSPYVVLETTSPSQILETIPPLAVIETKG